MMAEYIDREALRNALYEAELQRKERGRGKDSTKNTTDRKAASGTVCW